MIGPYFFHLLQKTTGRKVKAEEGSKEAKGTCSSEQNAYDPLYYCIDLRFYRSRRLLLLFLFFLLLLLLLLCFLYLEVRSADSLYVKFVPYNPKVLSAAVLEVVELPTSFVRNV